MTMTAPTYRNLRAVVEHYTDFLQLNPRQMAIFWQQHNGCRLLLFNGEFLVHTARKDSREAAIDAALEAAERLEYR